jgi:hypothetical protein
MARIRFKRGTTCSVQNYTDALVGEPVYDYETGRLYVKNIYNQMQPIDTLGVALEGPTTIYPGHEYNYVINNFSSFKTYSITHDLEDGCIVVQDGKHITVLVNEEVDAESLNLSIGVDNVIETFSITFGVEAIIVNSLESHTDGQEDVSITPTFIAPAFSTNPPGFDTHASTDWKLTTDSELESVVEQSLEDEINLTNWSPTNPLDNYTTYYLGYRYRGENIGVSDWVIISFKTSNVYVSAPVVISHSDGDVIGLNPTFTTSFSTIPDGVDFHLNTDWQLATDSSFSNIIEESLNDVSHKISWTPSTVLTPNQACYFRVRHRANSIGESDWTTLSFVTAYVEQPVITSHTDGDSNVDLNPTFTTTFSTAPAGFDTHLNTDWQLSSDSDFTTIIHQSLASVSNKTSWSVSGLSDSSSYYLRVRHRSLNVGESDWETIHFFTYVVSVHKPVITSHTDGQNDVVLTPTFETSAFDISPPGFDTHGSTDWQIATDSGFTSIIDESINDTVNLTSWSPNSLLGEMTYWFRVRYNSNSNGSSNYRILSFTTLDASIAQPTITSHSSGDNIDINPTFEVNSFATTPASADTYLNTEWQLATDSEFNNIVQTNIGTDIWTPTTLDYETDYYLGVRHNGNNLGSSDYTIISLETVAEDFIITPTITSHVNGDTINVNPTFEVSAFATTPSGADTHVSTEWELATDSGFINIVRSDTNINTTWSPTTLDYETDYYLRVRHVGNALGSSNYVTMLLTTAEDSTGYVILQHSDLQSSANNQTSPYDASASGDSYIFVCDANQYDSFYISNFSSNHIIQFINTPTGEDGDLNVHNMSYGDNEARLTVGDVDVYLTNLSSDVFWDASSFRDIFGLNSLVIGGNLVLVPTILSHTDGDTVDINPTFSISAFETIPAGIDTYDSTDWEIATDSGFSNIVRSATNTNTTWSPATLDNNVQYYFRVRHNGTSLVGEYNTITINTVAEDFINTPTITSHTDGDIITTDPTFEVSVFATTPSGADSYVSTEWELATDSSFSNIVRSDTNTNTTWSPATLNADVDYYLRVRYNGTTLTSEYVTLSITTESGYVLLDHSTLVTSASPSSPFDASASGNSYIFEFNTDQFNEFSISDFSSNHVLKFINTPTGDLGDININNSDYGDGNAIFSVGSVTLNLSNLTNSYFWDATSFMNIYGPNSIIVE